MVERNNSRGTDNEQNIQVGTKSSSQDAALPCVPPKKLRAVQSIVKIPINEERRKKGPEGPNTSDKEAGGATISRLDTNGNKRAK